MTVAVETTPQPIALRPLSPVHLRAMRNEAGILISWTRRTRIDGDSWAAQDVPLGEAAERYEIDIQDGDVVKRMLPATQTSVLYPADDETADFGGPLATLSIRVAQLSATVGRVFPATATLTL